MDVKTHIADHRLAIRIGGGHAAKADHRHCVFLGKGLLWPLEASHCPERLGILLGRRVQHRASVRLLDLVTAKKHLHPVGHLRDNGQIVSDIDGGSLELLDNLADGDKHLDLCGHIKCRGRLVKNDQIRAAGHCHRRHRALQLAAGYLMRVAEADLVRIGKTQPAIQVDGVAFRLGPVRKAVKQRRFGMLVDDLVRRVEACRGGLRDIGDPLAKKLALHIGGGADKIDAVKFHRAADNLAAVAGEPHRGKAKRGFASTRFADQAKNLAPFQVKIDLVDDRHASFVCDTLDFQIADFDKRFGS